MVSERQVDIFVLEELEMDFESVQTNVAPKVPMLKQNEFEMWRLRIEQYFKCKIIHFGKLLKMEILSSLQPPHQQLMVRKLQSCKPSHNLHKIESRRRMI